MDWVIKYWPLIVFAFGQILVAWKAYQDLKDRVRDNEEVTKDLRKEFEDHLKDIAPIMKDFLELQVEYKGLIEKMEAADAAAVRDRAEMMSQLKAAETSITQRIDSLFKLLVEKGGTGKGGN